jgi:hypothetical protein
LKPVPAPSGSSTPGAARSAARPRRSSLARPSAARRSRCVRSFCGRARGRCRGRGREALPLRGFGAIGDVAEEVDREEHLAGPRPSRAAPGRATSGLSPTCGRGRGSPFPEGAAVERQPPRQRRRLERVALLVEELEARGHLRERRGEELLRASRTRRAARPPRSRDKDEREGSALPLRGTSESAAMRP